jgi:glycosyltransferase involved in cell wall biosynthesis
VKLIVQIPCLNEEATLPETVRNIPRQIEGVDRVEILVIDDGSNDRTSEVARSLGVDHIVRNKHNMGLAKTFRRGLDTALALGADIIVNTDGDNQYNGQDIPKLVAPILAGQADMVVGDRETAKIEHFSRSRRFLQWFGSAVVRRLAGIRVPDTVSGFRAFSREAAIKLNIVSNYSYTIETIIQAGKRQLEVESVPIRINPKTRESRLFKNVPHFIRNSLVTMIRVYAMYQPLRMFFYIGSILAILGLIPILRFLFYYITGSGMGHIQSLVIGGVLLMMGFLAYLVGLVADLISFNRQLLEMTLKRVKKLEYAMTNPLDASRSTNSNDQGDSSIS